MVQKEKSQFDCETIIASPWVNKYTSSYMSKSQKDIADYYNVYQLTPHRQSRIVVMVGKSFGHGGVYSVHTQYKGLGVEYKLDYSMENGEYDLSLDEAKEVFTRRASLNNSLNDECLRLDAFDAIKVYRKVRK